MSKYKGKGSNPNSWKNARPNSTSFRKGNVPWNKSQHGVQVAWNKDKELGQNYYGTKGISRPWTSESNRIHKRGITLTKSHKALISSSMKRARKTHAPIWNKGLTKETDERVRQMGETISHVTKGCPKPFRTNKQGIRRFWFYGKDCKIKMRSRWEVAYAHYLDSSHVPWLYEYCTFVLDEFSYTPDFYLPDDDLFIEIKGYESWEAYKKQCKVQVHYGIKLLVVREHNLKIMGVL
jgi:hypothetical protein